MKEVIRALCYYGSILRISAIYSGSRVTKGIGIALLVVALMAVVAYTALTL